MAGKTTEGKVRRIMSEAVDWEELKEGYNARHSEYSWSEQHLVDTGRDSYLIQGAARNGEEQQFYDLARVEDDELEFEDYRFQQYFDEEKIDEILDG